MTQRQPWVVRCYRRAAWTIGDLSSEAADAFASLCADERRRGRVAAARPATRAFADLLRAGFIGNRPRPRRLDANLFANGVNQSAAARAAGVDPVRAISGR